MNHLHKIILINSASVRYQEMDLSGNIHVIGKNGTGKSTILRSILFFYSANTQKLGIKANQSSFTDFYFPHPNSWLIYEVKGTLGFFTLAAHRKSNRISFRFINGAYEREMFVDEKGMAHTSKELIAAINTRGLDHSRSIDKYEMYRSIIYGTITGAEKTAYRKYALFEAKSHENVWRTLSNIFLNAKLESQFIKKTLIESITDRSFSIDLTIIQKELEDFTHNRQDIETYRRLKSRPTIILRQYAQSKELAQQQILLAQDLGKSLNAGKAQVDAIKLSLKNQREELNQEESKAQDLLRNEQSQLHQLNRQLGVFENSLRMAQEKQNHYESIGINQLLTDAGKQATIERELENRRADYQALTSQYENIEQEFAVRLQALDNEQERGELEFSQTKSKISENTLKERERIYQEHTDALQQLQTQSQARQKESRVALNKSNQTFQELRIKEVQIRAKTFKQEEISNLHKQLAEVSVAPAQYQSQIALAKEQSKQLKLQESHELHRLEAEREAMQAEIQERIKTHEARITVLNQQIEQFQTSFMGWLDKRYPDWENSIGKVCREEVLFHPYLSPDIERLNELLFGVHIDLDEIEVDIPSLDSLQQEQQTLQTHIEQAQKEWLTFLQAWDKKKLNCEKRYQKKRKDNAKIIRQAENQLEQLALQQKKLRVQLDKTQQLAQQLKEKEVLGLQYSMQAQKDRIQEATSHLKQQETELQERTADLQTGRETRLAQILLSQHTQLDTADRQWQETVQRFGERRGTIQQEKIQALSGKGIDTEQVETVEAAIQNLEASLKKIAAQQKTIVLYQRDKEEYLDKIEHFQLSIEQLGNQIEEVKLSSARKRQEQEMILKQLRQTLSENQQTLTRWEEEFRSFDQFSQSPLYAKIESILADTLDSQSVESLHILIQQLNTNDQESTALWETLRKQMTAYLGHFRNGNVLNFPDGLQGEEAYRDFAINLQEFVEANKIEDFEREINKQYAQLIGKISEEVRALSSLEDEIYKIISRINKNFRESNFVGVVKEIQLKMEDSTNPVVTALKHIKQYDDEYGMQLGGPSLFNQSDNSENNRKAIELLTILTENLKGYKGDQLQLEDTFQLAFRVKENQNDTGWVERLSSVGSNGTDVLVKAMIYITLLSVFKNRSSKKNQEFRLHCIIDEVGILDTSYLQDLISFANAKNITLINGSPNENNPLAYNHIYQVRRDEKDYVRVHRLISQMEV